MCIRDSYNAALSQDCKLLRKRTLFNFQAGAEPVSYTHLDVYKRQVGLSTGMRPVSAMATKAKATNANA